MLIDRPLCFDYAWLCCHIAVRKETFFSVSSLPKVFRILRTKSTEKWLKDTKMDFVACIHALEKENLISAIIYFFTKIAIYKTFSNITKVIFVSFTQCNLLFRFYILYANEWIRIFFAIKKSEIIKHYGITRFFVIGPSMQNPQWFCTRVMQLNNPQNTLH